MSLPAAHVLAAFGVRGPLEGLVGGQGQAVRCGDLILKPGDNPAEVGWLAELHDASRQDGFRLARPVPAADGAWVVDGWWAQTALEGEHDDDDWPGRFAACRAFHAGVAHLPRPAFLHAKQDPWALADRMAWGEAPVAPLPRLAPAVARLTALLRPTRSPSQVIHGDIGRNLLFADGLPPAVIDMSPYFRPAAFALAVAAIDALVWEAAPPEILDDLVEEPEIDQMLVRAALRRILELDGHWRQSARDHLDDVDSYDSVMPLIAGIAARNR